jgi:hypothetical protein
MREFTQLETRILKAAASAAGNRVTIEYLADQAGCSVGTIYKRLQDPDFRAMFLETMKGLIVAEVPEILQKFAEKGKEGSYQHGKLILEIAGAYLEKKEISGDFSLREDETPFEDEKEIREFVKATLEGLAND